MTLNDAGLYFRWFCIAIATGFAFRWAIPVFLDGMKERQRESEKERIDAYLDSLERHYDKDLR